MRILNSGGERGEVSFLAVQETHSPRAQHTMTVSARVYRFVRSVKLKHIGLGLLVILVLDFFGAFSHMFEKDYHSDFHYPMDADVREYIMQLRAKQTPSVAPINAYNYSFISNCDRKCSTGDVPDRIHLVYVIKSAAENSERRRAIRNTWGFESRFSDVPVRTVFVLGVHQRPSQLQSSIEAEQLQYKDIVQVDFLDSYFNNTIKTMMGFTWAVTHCPQAKFYLFSDDDMYISTKNVLRFVRNPTHYPAYLEDPVFTLQRVGRNLRQFFDFELSDDVKLYGGFVFESAPHRHRSSKWHVSLSEYPYHLWPPYVTAGAYVVSREALLDMFYASYYTKHFRFDDVYLGLVAKKADVEPFHCDEFHYYKKEYDVHGYKYVVASHGFHDTTELVRVWNEQKSAGNA